MPENTAHTLHLSEVTEEQQRELRLLHLYGQPFEHSPALILGNIAALTALRDALNTTLELCQSTKVNAFAADGEGYDCWVAVCDERFTGKRKADWNTFPAQYQQEDWADMREWNRRYSKMWDFVLS